MTYFGLRPQDTRVPCPDCAKATLVARRGCLQVTFACPSCQRTFLLADLSRSLDDEAFAVLAEVVGDRFSDRV